MAGAGRVDAVALGLDGVVAKSGACGVFCCGSSRTGLGGALKVEDGNGDARNLAAGALLRVVAGEDVPAFGDGAVRDGEGGVVGSLRLRMTL